MTNKEDIEKAIQYYTDKYPKQLFWLLTKDDFMVAKVLWSNKTKARMTYYYPIEWGLFSNEQSSSLATTSSFMSEWQYHLQQMVIAEDPIKYLGENI